MKREIANNALQIMTKAHTKDVINLRENFERDYASVSQHQKLHDIVMKKAENVDVDDLKIKFAEMSLKLHDEIHR